MSAAYTMSATPGRAPETLETRLARLLEDGPGAIEARLAELDVAWTAGRAAKATAGAAVVAGTALGVAVHSAFFVLPVVGGAVFLQYLFGRRKPFLSAMFHSAGLPLGSEVEEEKLALRALRGDFRHLPTVHQVEDRDSLARLEGEGGIIPDDEEVKIAPRDAVSEVLTAARSGIIRR